MSVIAAERCVGGTDLTEPCLSPDGMCVGYVHMTAGDVALVVRELATGAAHALAVSPPLRPGRALAGGAWAFLPDGRSVVYVAVDGNLWLQSIAGEAATQLTRHGPERSASSPCVAADGASVVYAVDLAEVHRVDVASGRSTRLDDGSADFAMDPFIDSNSESVRWHAWNVPDMPWDRSRVQVRGADGVVRDEVATGFAAQQPRSLPDGRAVCLRDDRGWLNLWLDDAPLVEEQSEHGGPSWRPGQRSYAWSPDGSRFAFTRNEAGFGRLCTYDLATGAVSEIARGVHGQLSWQGDRLLALRTGARTPTEVVLYDTRSWERLVLAVGPRPEWAEIELPEPELVDVPVADGMLHARVYRPSASNGRLIVWLHGGPTDQWPVTFMPRLAFWLSRGWTILVPDHRGSTGHGRAYQQALRGRWGELDVADTLAVTAFAHSLEWALPGRTVLMGSSAGGFTALGAIAAEPDRFAAAVLLYPVSDLTDLVDVSHRFERHSLQHLVGPYPEARELYRDRSPTSQADRFARTPLLLLHGADDSVVPVRQTKVFAQRVQTAGGDVELHVYPGEGHGFRQPGNQLDEYRRTEDFLDRWVPVTSRS